MIYPPQASIWIEDSNHVAELGFILLLAITASKAVGGATRISASRLQQISHILQVPVEFFFEGALNALAPHGSNNSEPWMAQIDDFVSDPDGLRLIGAFPRIDNAALRRRIVMLVQEIAGDDGN